MKNVLLCVVLFAIACNAAVSQDLIKFRAFMTQFGKTYESTAEFDTRFHIFKQNLATIDQLNAKKTSAKFGITQFADMSAEEFKKVMLPSAQITAKDFEGWPEAELFSESEVAATPAAWDWRAKGAVTPIKNQGQCGSCWAFSAVGNMEGQWFLSGKNLTGLSEQNLVDCDHHCMNGTCDDGCNGGLMPNAFAYTIANGGIDTEASYPYAGAATGSCQFTTANVGAKINSWTMIAQNETQMATYLFNHGPVSIAVDAVQWQFYIAGVFEDPWCGTTLDHGVLIVGFGNEVDWIGNEINFWIVKNSWGETWGEEGYIYLERGSGTCGDNLFPCSSIIN